MKRTLSIALALVLAAISLLSVTAAAAQEPEVVFTIDTIEKQEGEIIAAGEQFTINVSTNEIDAICMIGFKFRYNKQLMTPVSGTAQGVLAQMPNNLVNLAPSNPTVGNSAVYGEVWITGMGFETLPAQSGPIATITFKAVKDITTTTLIFCCEAPEASDDFETAELMTIDYVDGGIKFAAPATTTTTVAPDLDATKKISLMPDAADKFTCVEGGEGSITVTAVGDSGFKFTADKGWPNAYYMGEEAAWVTVDTAADDAILYYDFTVSAGANVLVFFEGQNPGDDGAAGTYVSLNTIIDPSNVDANGNIIDLGAGTYKGEVHVKDLGCDEQFITDGTFRISGVKVFAVGGTVIVNELAVVGTKGVIGDDTTTTAETEETTTTLSEGDTTTTTVAKDTPKQDSAKTGDVSNAVIFIIVAIVAAALIVLSVILSKKKKQ